MITGQDFTFSNSDGYSPYLIKFHVWEFHCNLSTGSDFGLKKYIKTSREDIRTLRCLAAGGTRVGEMLLR
jgi:hypothetical protein